MSIEVSSFSTLFLVVINQAVINMSNTRQPEVYCFASVSKCYKTFRRLTHIPLEWDAKKETFIVRNSDESKCYIWAFLVFGVVGLANCSVAVWTLAFLYKVAQISNLIFCLICVPICLAVVGPAFDILTRSADIVNAVDEMKIILKYLGKILFKNKSCSQWCAITKARSCSWLQLFSESQIGSRIKLDYKIHRKYWETMNKFLNFLLLASIPFPLFLPAFSVAENVDVYVGIFQYQLAPIFCTSNISCQVFNWLSKVTRFLVILGSFMEGIRTQMVIIVVLFTWLEMQSRYLFLLGKLTSSKKFFSLYIKFRLVMKIVDDVLSNWIRALMLTCFFIIVASNVATIKLYSVLPLTLFWFPPACSVLYSISLFFVFTHMMGCFEQTDRILKNCRQHLGYKYYGEFCSLMKVKKLRSIPTVALKCGGSFTLKRDTKTTFFNEVILRTVDGILIWILNEKQIQPTSKNK